MLYDCVMNEYQPTEFQDNRSWRCALIDCFILGHTVFKETHIFRSFLFSNDSSRWTFQIDREKNRIIKCVYIMRTELINDISLFKRSRLLRSSKWVIEEMDGLLRAHHVNVHPFWFFVLMDFSNDNALNFWVFTVNTRYQCHTQTCFNFTGHYFKDAKWNETL